MGTKALIRLLLVVLTVGVIAVIVKFTGGGGISEVTSGDSTSRKKVMPDFPINEVAAVEILDRENSVTIKKGENTWVVAERDDFPADVKSILGMIRTVFDLKIGQPITIGPGHLSRLGLSDPTADDAGEDSKTATILNFKDAEGKELAALWLGKIDERQDNQPNPFSGGFSTTDAGRFVKPGDSNAVFLVEETFDMAKTDPKEWIDDAFFSVEQLKSIELKTGEPKEDWKLQREDLPDDFVLVGAKDDEELDSTRITAMKSAFSSPSFDDVFTGEEAKEQPTDRATFILETFEGFTYKISIGEENETNELPLRFEVSAKLEEKRKPGEEESDEEAKKLDELFANNLKRKKEKLAKEKSLAEGRVYKVRNFLTSSLLKKRSELLKPPPKPETPGVEIPGVGDTGKNGAGKGVPKGLPPGLNLPN
ncbi:MAG: DUF4340 domain-containing protein [Verrucomicrobiales bacterium]|nr:DUF4340 domain-containing protein [Verrucomicrobiales bacterium]